MSARTIAAWGVCAGVGGEGLANFALDSILTGQLNGTEKIRFNSICESDC